MDGGNVDWLPGMTPTFGEEGYGPNLNGNCRDSTGPWDIYAAGVGAVPRAISGNTVFGSDSTVGLRRYYLGHHASAFSGLRKGEHYLGTVSCYPTTGTKGCLRIRQTGGTDVWEYQASVNNWKTIGIEFVIADTATDNRIELQAYQDGGAGMVYFDHLELYQLDNCRQSKAYISIAHSLSVRTSRALGVF